ncbi:MAG: hypothetical protein ACRCXX_13500 [Cetobacterium sp.]|uniref:hypothetical protein n=1 Tax=Cetobacterium sp. TaxID=2071632 RepID=UPI003F2B308C
MDVCFSDLELVASGNYTIRELSLVIGLEKEVIKNIIKKYNIVYNSRGYIKWTDRDDKLIDDMKKSGFTNKEIADELGVGVTKVEQRVSVIGSSTKRYWTADEDKKLAFMRKMGNTYHDIGFIIERSPFACMKRYNQLKKEGKV